jgi:hypothetical protein
MAHDSDGNLFIAQGAAPYLKIAEDGEFWTVQTATPFAPVAALPTTTAKLELKNNTADRLMVVDGIWVWQLLATAVVWQVTPWAQVGAAVVSAVTGLVVYPNNGGAPYTSAATSPIVTAIDQTVVASGWQTFPGCTTSWGLAAATPGGAVHGDVNGRLVVPPGRALHVTVTGSVATASSQHCGARVYFKD